jgi:CRP-like cAMP-binding protein
MSGLAIESGDTVDRLGIKLGNFSPLKARDLSLLGSIASGRESFRPDTDIVVEGERPRSTFVVREGLACRYRNMSDGGRQIMTFLIPGDICDLHVFLAKQMDHSIRTLTPVVVSPISRDHVMDLVLNHPRILAALWWSSLQEEAMLRERIIALGRRNAHGRVAYLLCELLRRYEAVGLSGGEALGLPLTQLELADTVGLTPVHVSRVLKSFREQGLLELTNQVLRIKDIPKLEQIAGFNSDYLHLGGVSDEIAGYFDELDNT